MESLILSCGTIGQRTPARGDSVTKNQALRSLLARVRVVRIARVVSSRTLVECFESTWRMLDDKKVLKMGTLFPGCGRY